MINAVNIVIVRKDLVADRSRQGMVFFFTFPKGRIDLNTDYN